MNVLKITGKYLDQPILVSKFQRAVPGVLIAGGGLYTLNHIRKSPEKTKRKEAVKTFSVLSSTIASALLAPRITAKIVKGIELPQKLSKVVGEQKELIANFLNKNNVSKTAKKILTDYEGKVIPFKKVKPLFNELKGDKEGEELLKGLIPDPENIDSKHIFGKIKELSVLGLIPVLGGVAGGIAGDKLTEKDWKNRIPNKIKEGAYQYLANIFLCNIGAGAALYALEKSGKTSKTARAFGMIGGIILTGIVGGSAIANLIGKTCIDPLFAKKHGKHHNKDNHSNKHLYSERKPEALDVGLHVDDVATVAVLSGLKWIEPALPILYSISGYRAGIGYRNHQENKGA